MPGFADGDLQTELNHTAKWWTVIALTIYCRKAGVVPLEKVGAKNFFTFVWYLDNLDTLWQISAERNMT